MWEVLAARSLSSRREVAFSSASTRCMPLSASDSGPSRALEPAIARPESSAADVPSSAENCVMVVCVVVVESMGLDAARWVAAEMISGTEQLLS